MTMSKSKFILTVIISSLMIMGLLWFCILEEPYVKSKYYRTDFTVTVELQWPVDADYCEVADLVVYDRPFVLIKPKPNFWAWTIIRPYNWYNESVNTTRIVTHGVERPGVLTIWIRYYDETVEEHNGLESKTNVVLDTIKYEYLVIPMSR